eukprot:754218-Alexandrium_andersonii.AAC.1
MQKEPKGVWRVMMRVAGVEWMMWMCAGVKCMVLGLLVRGCGYVRAWGIHTSQPKQPELSRPEDATTWVGAFCIRLV